MQLGLFDGGAPALAHDLRRATRVSLSHGAWIDVLPGWLTGHRALFDELTRTVRWRAERREMYGRELDVPRLVARLPQDGAVPEVVRAASDALSRHYHRPLRSISAAWYRDGRDSVAWHGDRMGPQRHDTVVAIVSLGAGRRFLLRPRGGSVAHRFTPGEGDLLVMGGSCQHTWEHAVPKVAVAEPRLSLMFRPTTGEAGSGS